MVNVWITALKKWNTSKGGPWCVPRKGTKEYDEVRKIMDGVKPKKVVKSKPVVKKEVVKKVVKKVVKPVVKPKKKDREGEIEEVEEKLSYLLGEYNKINDLLNLRNLKKGGVITRERIKKIGERHGKIEREKIETLKVLTKNEFKNEIRNNRLLRELAIEINRLNISIVSKINKRLKEL